MHVKCPLNLGGPRGLHKFSRGFAGHLGSTYLEVGLLGNPSELVLGSLVTSYLGSLGGRRGSWIDVSLTYPLRQKIGLHKTEQNQ